MRLLKPLLLAVIILVVLLAGVGLLLPRQVHVERVAVIDAPPATVFTILNSYKLFNKWSPWADLDPSAQYTIDGPATGVGAKMSWKGDPKTVGEGSQQIQESRPYEMVKTSLDFGAQGVATGQFNLTPEGNGTKVVWGFDSDLGMNPISRYFGLVMDRMLGPDFEKGLTGLKTLAEAMPKDDFADLKVEEVQVSPVTVAYVPASCSQDLKDIAKTIGTSYATIGKFISAHKVKIASAPRTVDKKWKDNVYEFEAVIPIDQAPAEAIPADSPVQVKQSYGGKALKVVHKGPYAGISETFQELRAYMAASGYEEQDFPWDEYISDPGNTPEAELLTNIFYPVK